MKFGLDFQELDDLPSILTPNEVAEILCLHINTVYNLLHQGKIQGFRVGKSWRIHKKALLSR